MGDQSRDRLGIGIGQHAMPEIEDERPARERPDDPLRFPEHGRAAGQQGDRIEIALQAEPGQRAAQRRQRHRGIEAQTVDRHGRGEALQMQPRTARECDDRHLRMLALERAHDARHGLLTPAPELALRQDPGPAVEQLQDVRAGLDLRPQMLIVASVKRSISRANASGSRRANALAA